MKSNWTTTTIDDVCSLVTDGAHNKVIREGSKRKGKWVLIKEK